MAGRQRGRRHLGATGDVRAHRILRPTASTRRAGDRSFDDGFGWFPADAGRPFDPLTDIADGRTDPPGVEWVEAVIERCTQGLAMLEAIDPSGFDAATTQTWTRGVEQLHRRSGGGRHRRWAGRRRPDPADRDWSEARARLGNVDTSKLCRTEAQRRADALLEMARAAVACPPDAKRPLPTVNFLLDEVTARAAADNDLVDPLSSRDVTSRTDRGARVDPDAIIGVSLWAMIRRVVTDSEGVVTDLGRTSRLCSGYAREAVMLLEPTCIRPGCDQPHSTDIC